MSVISKMLIVGATILFDFCWLQGLRHQLLIYLAENNYEKMFKMLTFCSKEMKKFRDEHGKAWRGV